MATEKQQRRRATVTCILSTIIRRGICTFLGAWRIAWRQKPGGRAGAGRRLSSIEIRLKADTQKTQCRRRAWRVPLMSRHICRSIGRRTLINKGYSKEIAIIYTLRAWAERSRVARLLPTGRTLHVCIHTCSWRRCHVTRAFSFHANTRCTVCA